MSRWHILVLVLAFPLAGCTLPLQSALDEPAANEVMSALERAGIGAEKIRDDGSTGLTFTVRVSRGDSAPAMDLLRSLGLPRAHRSGFAQMYAQPSLVPSATEERARYLDALAGELEKTLETVDGVVGARVHLVPAETDILSIDGKPRVPAGAAVLLKLRAGAPPLKEAEVQKLVAGSVPGLSTAAVAVVVTPAPEWSGSAQAGSMATFGPLRIASGSRPLLLASVLVALAVIAVLATLLLTTARRLAAVQLASRNGSGGES